MSDTCYKIRACTMQTRRAKCALFSHNKQLASTMVSLRAN
ncbi:hypothetical protein BURPS1655_K0348 [Burkholderia pseudomallei 1655]|nr:hypothetical protein BURPS1655_K0348 [Burkholderia pseudomallei 1655]